MAKVADTYLIYQVLKRLTTPFEETEAFELGLIDKNGKLIKKPKDSKEKNAYTLFDRFYFYFTIVPSSVHFLLRTLCSDFYLSSNKCPSPLALQV